MVNNPKYIILHHSADQTPGNQLKRIENWHKFRFNMLSRRGFWTGYHFLIERSGEVIQTRDLNEEGAHCKGRNLESVGVCLAGNFDFEIPTEKQLDALINLFENLQIRIKNKEVPTYYHFRFADTHCPGFYFQGKAEAAFVKDIKINLVQRLILWISKLLRN